MPTNIKSFLYKFDFIGIIPQLHIFNYDRNKTIYSSLASIIIILVSISFGIYSLTEFINQDPIISYYKNNDFKTNRTIFLNNTFLMFKVEYFINNTYNFSDIVFESFYFDSHKSIDLIVESCQLGKNIDLKYKNLIESFEKNEGQSINEYYCFNYIPKNLSLFYNPNNLNNSESGINLLVSLIEEENCFIEKFNLHIITENDILDHYNKTNPIIPYYKYDLFSYDFNSKILFLNYDLQFIKYESDDGIFFKNLKSFNGIGYSGVSSIDNVSQKDYCILSGITFRINKSNFDNYKRNYKRLSSLLADVTSVVNLMISIIKLFSFILLDKKMSKEIVENLIIRNLKKEKPKTLIKQNNTLNNIFKDIENNNNDNNKFSERNNIKSDICNKSSVDENLNKSNKMKLDFHKTDVSLKEVRANHAKIKVMKKLNFWHIIKSYFCFKDKKIKFINLCHKIVFEDLCIDRILKRLYKLEKIYFILSEKEHSMMKLIINKEFKEINKCLSQIIEEIIKI